MRITPGSEEKVHEVVAFAWPASIVAFLLVCVQRTHGTRGRIQSGKGVPIRRRAKGCSRIEA